MFGGGGLGGMDLGSLGASLGGMPGTAGQSAAKPTSRKKKK